MHDRQRTTGFVLAVAAAGCLASVAAQGPHATALEALRSADAAERRDALARIDRAGLPADAGAVSALAADPDDAIQLAALDTLLDLLMTEAPNGGARAAFEAGIAPARPVPARAYEPVAQAMTDANPQVRLTATHVFGVLAASRHGLVPESAAAIARRALEPMVTDGPADLRVAAIGVSGRLFRASPAGPPPVPSLLPEPLIERLVAAMNEPDARVQAAAMETLGRAREARALDALTERLAYHRQQGPRELGVAALDALARLAHPSSTEMVRALATDPWSAEGDPYVAVLFARERLLHDGSAEALRKVVADPRLGARAQAYLAELVAAP